MRIVQPGAPVGLVLLAALVASLAGCPRSHERRPRDDGGSELASSASLVIDEASLYWGDPGRGAIVRAPRGGGAVTVLSPAEPALYAPLAVTSTDVVWVDAGDGIEVYRVALGGGRRALIADVPAGPIGVAADDTHVYFSGGSSATGLLEVALAGGGERVVWPEIFALGLRLDGDDIFGTTCGREGVWRVARDGSGRSRLVPGAFCPITLALDARYVYFSDYAEPTMPGLGGTRIFRAPRSGGAATPLTLSEGLAFAVHRGTVYVALEGAMLAVAGEGGARTEIAPAGADVRGVAVDDDLVYWTEAAEDGALDLVWAPRPG